MSFESEVHTPLCIFQSGSESTDEKRWSERTLAEKVDLSPLFTPNSSVQGLPTLEFLGRNCFSNSIFPGRESSFVVSAPGKSSTHDSLVFQGGKSNALYCANIPFLCGC